MRYCTHQLSGGTSPVFAAYQGSFWPISVKFQKKKKKLEFSKIPKIFGEIDEILGILENSRRIQQNVFFWISVTVENLKTT